MPEPNLIFEDVAENVSTQYALCVRKARELFEDESAVQSAAATMFIQINKTVPALEQRINALKDKTERLNREAIPSAVKVWEWHFRDYISEFGGRISGMIHYYVSQNYSPETIEEEITARVYHLRCEKLNIEESNALAKEMFGE